MPVRSSLKLAWQRAKKRSNGVMVRYPERPILFFDGSVVCISILFFPNANSLSNWHAKIGSSDCDLLLPLTIAVGDADEACFNVARLIFSDFNRKKLKVPVASLCEHCGTPLKWEANFCSDCQKPINSAKKLLQVRKGERRLEFKLAFALLACVALIYSAYRFLSS